MLCRHSSGITVLVCLSAARFLHQVSAVNDVQCSFVEAKGLSFDAGICECYDVDDAPWPTDTEATATHPENVSVEFEKTNGSIHAHIHWVHRASFLVDVKDGFYLELSGDGNLHYYYNCDFNRSKLKVRGEKEVQFHFNECCGSLESGSGWKPGMELTVLVHARPMYGISNTAYHTLGVGRVPYPETPRERKRRCKTRKGNGRKKKCRKKRTQKYKFHQKPSGEQRNHNNKTLLIIVLASVCSFTCVLSVVVILCEFVKVRRKYRRKRNNRSLLIIGENGDRFIPFVNCLVEIMKSHGSVGTKVITNVRNANEIARVGISQWVNSNIKAADVIIFIATEEEQLLDSMQLSECDEVQCSVVRSALNVAESVSWKNGSSPWKKFLVLDVYALFNPSSLPFCTFYTLERDFSKFMKHVLHLNQFSSEIDDDFRTLKKLSQRDKNSLSENITVHPHDGRTCNNLNRSLLYTSSEEQSKPLLTANIADDQLPSVESNECKL